MMEDKQNILKSFQGKKIDESVHVARWGTISNQDQNRMIFNKYAMGANNSPRSSISQVLQNQNMYNTQQSQVHEIDTGFKKLKNNQIEKLKQLKQQYEVLKNLNIEQKPSMSNLHQKVHSDQSSIHQQSHSEEMISSSSRHKRSVVRKENVSREAQILALQKKQLQMVVNNSMKKIQQLLHNQMEYKKQLHELKLQVSGRQNVDVEYQTMIKTLKKNEMNQIDNIQALKKENEKVRAQVRQLNEKISSLQGEIMLKDQQIRLLLGEKRKSEDLIRLQKDRYFNLDIDYKKTKMEFELLEKDKNSQINRLMRQLETVGSNRTRDLEIKFKRYEEEIQIKDKRYNVLLTQLEDMRTKLNQQDQELNLLKSSQNNFDTSKIQQILVNFREKNDSVALTKQINEIIDKMHQIDHSQNDYLRNEISQLKTELEGLKENQKENQAVNNILIVQPYVSRIEELQRELRNQAYEKDELTNKLKRQQREYQNLSRKLAEIQNELEYYQELEKKLRDQIKVLRQENRFNKLKPSVSAAQIPRANREVQIKLLVQIESLQKEVSKYKEQIDQMENQLRFIKRQADQNEFKASKASTQSEFRLKMQQSQHNVILSRITEELEKQKKEFLKLRQQFDTYKDLSQRKISEKDAQLENFRGKLRATTDGTQTSINNIKHQYQALLKSERQRFKLEVEQLSTQVTSLSKINEKYLQETSKYVQYENQLSCLRQIMRRSIHLSQGVDHLWRIKETEYQNVNQILRQISAISR